MTPDPTLPAGVAQHRVVDLRTLADDGHLAMTPTQPATLPMPAIEPATAAPLAGHGAEPLAVRRCFAFVDICGFTSFCDREGERAAIRLLTDFRAVTRAVAARRGVRIAKWLGDGVMLVSGDPAPLVATVVEVEVRTRVFGLDTHAGVAAGPVLLFEGDDYVGRPVNLAARLCDVAGPAEVLVADVGDDLPAWVHRDGQRAIEVAGIGQVAGVDRLIASPEIQAELAAGAPAA